jgi:hypothetical protein
MLALMRWAVNLQNATQAQSIALPPSSHRHCYARFCGARRMSQNLAELAETAITALKALNTELKRQQSEWAMSRYGKHFAGNGVSLSDNQMIELLTEIVDYDEDPAGTLQELAFEFEDDAGANEADYRYEEMRSNELLDN